MDLLERAIALRQTGAPAVVVTLVETRGSTPRKPGARMLVHANGRIEGSIGGGAVEHAVQRAAAHVLQTGEPELLHYELTAELAMCCGGQMTFFVEPLMRPPTLIVFGCGHVGAAVIRSATPLGFDVIAVDDREDRANAERLPQATQLITSYEPDDLADLPFGPDTYVLIATHEHSLDQRLLELCVAKPLRFCGCIGSRRKAHMQRERLAAKSFDAAAIDRIVCPVGLDVGAQTPEEIAVAICAQLVSVRRGGARFEGG